MNRLKLSAMGLILFFLANLSWSDSCEFPHPDTCSHVGCVNEEMRSCKSKADINRLNQMPAGKENVDTCLRKIAKDHSEVLTVDAIIAALVACQNKNAYEEKKTSLQVRYFHLWLTALTYGPHEKRTTLRD